MLYGINYHQGNTTKNSVEGFQFSAVVPWLLEFVKFNGVEQNTKYKIQ